MKRHNDSPETFTLIQGTATLLTKKNDSFTETHLEKGSAYLAQAGTWHYLEISEDAIVFVAENSGMLPQNTDTLTLEEPYEI
jgi:quercetin dioxygenase-like cupin family protein